MRFGAPLYIGDTIEVASTVLGVKPSGREPDRGVVHVQTTGRNQNGEVVSPTNARYKCGRATPMPQ